jgi:hypothetical protein
MGKILIPLEANARLSFETLGAPKDYEGDKKFRWAATWLIPAENAFKKVIDAEIRKVAENKWGKKAEAILEDILTDRKATCWINGNKKDYAGYAGNFALTSYRYEADGRPLVLDNDASPLYNASNELNPGKAGRLFGGCFVRGEVEIYAQDNSKGKGIRCGLLQIQRVKKGDSFGGASQPVAGVLSAIADDEDDDADLS